MHEPVCYSWTSCSLVEVDPDVYDRCINLEIADVDVDDGQVHNRVYRMKL